MGLTDQPVFLKERMRPLIPFVPYFLSINHKMNTNFTSVILIFHFVFFLVWLSVSLDLRLICFKFCFHTKKYYNSHFGINNFKVHDFTLIENYVPVHLSRLIFILITDFIEILE